MHRSCTQPPFASVQISKMSLSWLSYLSCIDNFLVISKQIDDAWSMIGERGSRRLPENCYLLKTVMSNIQTTSLQPNRLMCDEEYLEETLPDTEQVESNPSPAETIVWEYHILFNPSYGVPVLYFNVRNTSGKLLRLEDVWNILNVPKEVLAEKWSFVSQSEHPVLRRPFFYLHPCKSFAFLEISKGSNINPLITWLSSIAHIVHLPVPLGYGKHCFVPVE